MSREFCTFAHRLRKEQIMKVINVKVNGQNYKAVFKNDTYNELMPNNGRNEATLIEDVADGWGIWFNYKGDTSQYPTDGCDNAFALFVGFKTDENGQRTSVKQYAQVWNDTYVVDEF